MQKTEETQEIGSINMYNSIASGTGSASIVSEAEALGSLSAETKNELSSSHSYSSYKIWYWLSRLVQGICWPLFYIGYRLAFSLAIKGKSNLKGLKGPIIFISNHIGVYDSFIFDLFVPPFSAIPPFRFMGTTKFKIWYLRILKYTGIVHIIYALFGVFKVNYGEGAEKALTPAYEIIRNGGTVAIFPEGKVWQYDRYGTGVGEKDPIGPFKWGAAILAKNTGAVVVPVSFHKHPRNMFRDYLDVTIGQPFYVDKNKTPEEISIDMREKVVGVYNG